MIEAKSAKPLDDYKIHIELSDGRNGIFDVSPYLERGIFRQLKDKEYFRQVRVAFGGIAWPNEQDFSPETLEMELIEDASLST